MAQSNPPGGPAQGLAKILGAMADKQRQKQAQGEAQQLQDTGAITQMVVHKPNDQFITDKKIEWFWHPSFTNDITVITTYYKEDREDGINAGDYLVTFNVSQQIQKKNAPEFLVFNPMDAGELGLILKAAHEWQHLWPQFAGEFLLVQPEAEIVPFEGDKDNEGNEGGVNAAE